MKIPTIKIVMIVLIIIAIVMQIKVYNMLKTKSELMAEPSMYTAQIYNLDYCECAINENSTLIFNKTSSIIKTERKKGTTINYSISVDWNKVLGDNHGAV
jgi:hypothetical protein